MAREEQGRDVHHTHLEIRCELMIDQNNLQPYGQQIVLLKPLQRCVTPENPPGTSGIWKNVVVVPAIQLGSQNFLIKSTTQWSSAYPVPVTPLHEYSEGFLPYYQITDMVRRSKWLVPLQRSWLPAHCWFLLKVPENQHAHEHYLLQHCPSHEDDLPRHGIPETALSDNGPQYALRNLLSLQKHTTISHISRSLYFPQNITWKLWSK